MDFIEHLKQLNEIADSLEEKKPAKGKKWVTNGVSHGDSDYKISPGTDRGDSYCARSQGINKDHNIDCRETPNKPNCLSRKKWKCRGKKSLKESFQGGDVNKIAQVYEFLAVGDAFVPNKDEVTKAFLDSLVKKNKMSSDLDDPSYGEYYFISDENDKVSKEDFVREFQMFINGDEHHEDKEWDNDKTTQRNSTLAESDDNIKAFGTIILPKGVILKNHDLHVHVHFDSVELNNDGPYHHLYGNEIYIEELLVDNDKEITKETHPDIYNKAQQYIEANAYDLFDKNQEMLDIRPIESDDYIPYGEFNEDDTLSDDNMYVKFHKDYTDEEPFTVNDVKYKYVWAKYPDGKIDIGTYIYGQDLVYDINWFQKNILKQIPEATSVGGMGGYSAFGYDAPAFMTPIKKKIYEYIKPLSGEYVKTKDGKNVTPKMIKEWLGTELNEIHDKPFYGGGKMVKINPKCATFPYCSQGNSEDKPIKLIGETKDTMDEYSWDYISEVAEIAKKKPQYIAKLIREYYLKSRK